MTLARVAEKLDRTHSNIIHHFGSAEKMQAALMSMMVEDLARAMTDAIANLEPGETSARVLVDAVFDAFDEGGAAVLAAWIMLSNKQPYLAPVRTAVHALARSVDERLAQNPDGRLSRIPSVLLFLSLFAFADALVGPDLRRILDRDSRAARDIAVDLVPQFFQSAADGATR